MNRILATCFLILSTIIYSVVEKNHANKILKDNCIEVYLYKEPILPENCVYIKDLKKYQKEIKFEEKFKKSKLIFDTIHNELLHGGLFLKTTNNITKIPIIQNSNIKLFYQNSSNLLIVKGIKLAKIPLPKDSNHLKQFVILKNKKPIMCGYLYNVFASANLKNTNIILCEVNTSKDFTLLKFDIKNKISKINLKQDYPELYNAFKNSNRLIE